MLSISPLCAFDDNYIWLLRTANSAKAVVVDPGQAGPVIRVLEEEHLQLAAILITHHHWDHTGGIDELLRHQPGAPVYGPANPKIPAIDHTIADGSVLCVLGARFEVLAVPGHTLDHHAFYCPQERALFCGDTLFVAGCGRLFEGTPTMMFDSLNRLAKLPPDTRIYCAHEYTAANLRFAAAAEPENQVIAQRQRSVAQLREQGLPTVPSTIADELATNPFLRCDVPRIQEQAAETSGVDTVNKPAVTFAALRAWKDRF